LVELAESEEVTGEEARQNGEIALPVIWCEARCRTSEFAATDHQPCLAAGLRVHGRPTLHCVDGHGDVGARFERRSAATELPILSSIERPKTVAFAGRIGCASGHPKKASTRPTSGLISGRRVMKRVIWLPHRGTLRIAASLVLASTLTVQAQQPSAPAQAPIKVGIVTFLTGPAAAPFGIPGRNAA